LRWLIPAPLTSAALFAIWLLLARSVSVGQLLLGAVLAFAAPRFIPRMRVHPVRVRRPLLVVRYLFTVGGDVLRSNVEVALGVLAWRWRRPRAGFVVVPLDLRDPVGLSVLSMVTTVVPGTVWSELALDRSALRLHVWSLPDEAAFVAHFKSRYELPLKEIFE
jgi:multicomponent K+:H+ antiporter subunit E